MLVAPEAEKNMGWSDFYDHILDNCARAPDEQKPKHCLTWDFPSAPLKNNRGGTGDKFDLCVDCAYLRLDAINLQTHQT